MLIPSPLTPIPRAIAFTLTASLLLACGDPVQSEQPEPPQGPDISLISADLSTNEIPLGDSVELVASLENTGDRPGPFALDFQVDGQTVHTLIRYVDPVLEETPGERDVTFRWTPDEAGEYSFSVNELDAGTLSVTALEPNLQLAGFTSPDDLDFHLVDEPLSLFALLENTGRASGELPLTLFADGDPVAESTAVVPAGVDSAELLQWTPDSPGVFDLSINDLQIGSLTVAAPPTITLLSPTNEPGEFFLIEGEDSNGLYAQIDFSAETLNPGDSLSWFTLADESDDGAVHSRHLGDGSALTARLYSNRYDCGAITEHLITVEATSPEGLTSELTHRIILLMGMC